MAERKIYSILLAEPNISENQAKRLARLITIDLLSFQQHKICSVMNNSYQSTKEIMEKTGLVTETKNVSVLLNKLELLNIVTSKMKSHRKYWKLNESYSGH